MPPVRFELTTPGLRDQCSTTELKRLMRVYTDCITFNKGSPTVYHYEIYPLNYRTPGNSQPKT